MKPTKNKSEPIKFKPVKKDKSFMDGIDYMLWLYDYVRIKNPDDKAFLKQLDLEFEKERKFIHER